MALFPITITNPGAEMGNTTGWVAEIGPGLNVTASSPHSGTYSFGCNGSLNDLLNSWYQTVNIDPSEYDNVDDELYTIEASCWHKSGSTDKGRMYVEFRDADNAVLTARTNTAMAVRTSWTQLTITGVAVPPLTRKIRLGIDTNASTGDGIGNTNQFDDFEMSFNDVMAVDIKNYQLGLYAIGTYPAAEARALQLGLQVVGEAETSNTFHDLNVHQLGLYALVSSFPDRRDLRAWTFTQDEHDFYVIQLGDVNTLVYDRLTGQWASWRSPDYNYWRANDGCGWEGFNVACDSRSGKIWKIDPEGRLDYGTTPITSVVTGGIPLRERKVIPCYDAELSVSDGQFAPSIPEGTVGLSLRTSDDGGNTWHEHGEILSNAFGEETLIRWYGLGTMDAPGRIFEITDTGYARRIDGLNVELGDYGGN